MSCKRLWLMFLVLCFASAGCISFDTKPDPTRYFALTSLPRSSRPTQDAAGTNDLALGLGPIKIPGYLDRPQFVTRISQNRFAISENDRWAEPLDDNFLRVLSQDISILLQTDRIVTYPWERSQQPKYQVQVEVLRFEPNAKQSVELWARWSIIDSAKKTISVKESYLTQPEKDKSVETSVAAMSAAVSDLSKEIASAIGALTVAQRP